MIREFHSGKSKVPASPVCPSRRAQTIAHECLDASVLLCDIVSFTKLSASIEPVDLVAILSIVFGAFDSLTTKHGVYKVETIGKTPPTCVRVA